MIFLFVYVLLFCFSFLKKEKSSQKVYKSMGSIG